MTTETKTLRNFTDTIRAAARRHPDAPAVVLRRRPSHEIETRTYGELVRIIDAVAGRLIESGVTPGQICSVGLRAHTMALCASLSVASIGAIAAPPNDEKADWLLVHEPSRAPATARRIVLAPDEFEVPSSTSRTWPDARCQDSSSACMILHSSGTTGRSKRIAVTHGQMLARMARVMAAFAVPAGARLACPMGPRGGYGFRTMVCALAGGSTIVDCTSAADGLVATIESRNIVHLVVSPLQLEELVAARGAAAGPLRSLAVVEVGGSRLPDALHAAATRVICPEIVVSYGSSEAGVVAKGRAGDLAGIPGAVGRLLEGIEAQSVDDAGHPLAAGQEGILRMRGPGCVDSYIGAERASALAFHDGWFYPGDRGYITGERILVIEGRERELINAGGPKFAPAVIEDALTGLPGLLEIAAFGAEDALGIEKPWIAIVTGRDFNEAAFRGACRDRLGKLTPAGVLVVRALPRNENGKVVRWKLVELAHAHARGGARTPD